MNEDVFPIEKWDFPACHVSLQGVYEHFICLFPTVKYYSLETGMFQIGMKPRPRYVVEKGWKR